MLYHNGNFTSTSRPHTQLILKWHFLECYSALSIAIITMYAKCICIFSVQFAPIKCLLVNIIKYTTILSISFLLLSRKKNSIHFITITNLLHFAWLSKEKSLLKGIELMNMCKTMNVMPLYATYLYLFTLNYVECAFAKWITNFPLTHPRSQTFLFYYTFLFCFPSQSKIVFICFHWRFWVSASSTQTNQIKVIQSLDWTSRFQ